MKNLIVANYHKEGRWPVEELQRLLKAQIDNSLDLGWSVSDLLVLTNFDFEYRGANTTLSGLNSHCFTGSKIFAVQLLFRKVGDVIWAHDLDAWQNVWFDCPKFKDVGISCYSRPKLNGGSVFWRVSAVDIVDDIVAQITTSKANKEEPTINKLLSSDKYKARVTVLDHTYNVGCSGYVPRFERALKPIRVCHFHPTNSIAWETHALDRSGVGISVTPRLEKLIRGYWPKLAAELSKKGKKRREEKINERRRKQGTAKAG